MGPSSLIPGQLNGALPVPVPVDGHHIQSEARRADTPFSIAFGFSSPRAFFIFANSFEDNFSTRSALCDIIAVIVCSILSGSIA